MKKTILIIILVVLLISGVAGVSYYFISKDSDTSIDNNDKVNSDANNEEEITDENFSKENVQKFLDDSLVSAYLHYQGKDIEDVKSFLENYDNEMKLMDLIHSMRNWEEQSKNEVLQREIEMFGMNTGLVFHDVGYGDDILHDYDEKSEKFINKGGHGYDKYYVLSKVEEIEKNGNNYIIKVKKAWSDFDSIGADCIYKNYEDRNNLINPIYKLSQNYDISQISSNDEVANIVFNTESIYDKLDTYEYVISYDENYVIKSYKKIS